MAFVILIDDLKTPEKLETELLASADAALVTSPVFDEIAADIFKIEEQVFSSKGRRGGGSWKSLADSTIKRKGGNTKILRDSDELYDSVTQPGATFQILDITNEGLVFGTERPWAFVHQYGSKNVPARPFLRFTPFDLDRWNNMLLRHITKMFSAAENE